MLAEVVFDGYGLAIGFGVVLGAVVLAFSMWRA